MLGGGGASESTSAPERWSRASMCVHEHALASVRARGCLCALGHVRCAHGRFCRSRQVRAELTHLGTCPRLSQVSVHLSNVLSVCISLHGCALGLGASMRWCTAWGASESVCWRADKHKQPQVFHGSLCVCLRHFDRIPSIPNMGC